MIIDGRKLAAERILQMHSFVQGLEVKPRLVALTAMPTVPTQQFLKIKKRVARQIGIDMSVVEVDVSQGDRGGSEALRTALDTAHGVVIQLPFPSSIDVEELLKELPVAFDPDVMGVAAQHTLREGSGDIRPPVTSVIRLLCKEYGVNVKGRRVAVVGQGRLVGAPVSLWLEEEGAQVVRLTRESQDLVEEIRSAHILVLGAGVPGLVRRDMVQDGVVIFDAGTSEEGGKVVGDADPLCAERASLFTPVPGGIGPLAVCELFANLLRLQLDYRD